MSNFDPADLVLLTVGFIRGASLRHHETNGKDGKRPGELTLEDAELLEATAVWLADEWEVSVCHDWDGVWAYDVAEPVGLMMGYKGLTDPKQIKSLIQRTIEDARTSGSGPDPDPDLEVKSFT